MQYSRKCYRISKEEKGNFVSWSDQGRLPRRESSAKFKGMDTSRYVDGEVRRGEERAVEEK